MARVARECVVKTHELTRKLELTLGPGTSELTVRVGLHSGPVTGKIHVIWLLCLTNHVNAQPGCSEVKEHEFNFL